MISYLKDTTFGVNEVIAKAWALTKKHYLSIATLCFLMFVTSNASTLMAFFLKDVSRGLSLLMALFFILLYFTINLSLFKYILHLLDDEKTDVTIVSTLPTKRQIIRFLIAAIYFGGCVLSVGILLIPILYILDPVLKLIANWGWVNSLTEAGHLVTRVAVGISVCSLFIIWLRISFFPFFIVDREANPFQSIRLSLAITRGNFTKILILLLVLGGFQVLYLFFSFIQWPIVSFVVNIVSSFIIVPLSSVALTIAYRKMMSEYDGDQEPEILKNIV